MAATLGHEFEKHYDEHIEKNGYGENWKDEIDACEYNLKNADRFGNTPEEVQGFKDQINTYKERIREREGSDEPRRKEEPERDRENRERSR
ncbi:hypothetical protein [Stenotrophomonas sp. YIM B06876]|uniref:hypothetical protein n=1 Tax=Stenotrophomonas sp. YIM B06876 TaxID=3060211 RepID=UPI002739E6D8|nr:hypothetical protein [Stenotrophomonas sp. YIM B06876]